MLTVCVEAGLGFDASLAKVADNAAGRLAAEFSRVLEVHLGRSPRTGVQRPGGAYGRGRDQVVRRCSGPGRSRWRPCRRRAARAGRRAAGAPTSARRGEGAEGSREDHFPVLSCIFPVFFIIVIGPGRSGSRRCSSRVTWGGGPSTGPPSPRPGADGTAVGAPSYRSGAAGAPGRRRTSRRRRPLRLVLDLHRRAGLGSRRPRPSPSRSPSAGLLLLTAAFCAFVSVCVPGQGDARVDRRQCTRLARGATRDLPADADPRAAYRPGRNPPLAAGVRADHRGNGSSVAVRHLFDVPQHRPAGAGLVDTGPYRLVRHPLYLGELVAVSGFAHHHRGGHWLHAVLLLTLLALQLYRADREEGLLAGPVPGSPDYAARTWRIVPGSSEAGRRSGPGAGAGRLRFRPERHWVRAAVRAAPCSGTPVPVGRPRADSREPGGGRPQAAR